MINWFKKKWLITLIGVIALSLLVWFVGPLIEIADKAILASVISRLMVIFILFLLWLISNLSISLKKQKNVNQFSQDLEDQADESATAESKISANSNDLVMLKKHFDDTLNSLKESNWGGKDGIRNLYELPWYVIIGAPGSGKTTALINSGLNFPLTQATGHESLSGIGGTRFSEWLITDDAVLIDTAGRYTTHDSDENTDATGWKDFLSLLKKQKKHKPVNGVLVTVSMQDILQKNDDEKNFQIKSIQKRLQELNQELGIQVPVYFMLTKCDLINGFQEFFGDFGQDEKKQVWGITFPPETINEIELNIKTAFLPEYDNLIASVNQRLIARLFEEKQSNLKGQILAFPQQMAVVRDQLNEFIVALFSPSRFYQKVMLRGVYFTSGAQKGQPIDQVKEYFSDTFGLNEQDQRQNAEKETSFFLYGLLKNIIFNESGLGGTNFKFEKRFKWLSYAAYASMALVLLTASIVWLFSYQGNSQRVEQVDSNMAAFYEKAKPLAPRMEEYNELETLPALKNLYLATRVYDSDRDNIPLNIQYGLYQGNNLIPVTDSYFQQLNHLFIPSVARRLIAQMRAHQDDSEYLYQALKAYLMLGMPERLNKEFVHNWMYYDWQQRFSSKAHVQELVVHLDNSLGQLEPIKLNQAVVAEMRAKLLEVPLPKQIYNRLKLEAEGPDFSFEKNIGNHLYKTFNGIDVRVPWLYTKEGYQNYFLKNSMSYIRDFLKNDWVLGTSLKDINISDFKSFYKEVERLYLKDYIAYWEKALMSVKVKKSMHLDELITRLDYISGMDLPFKTVLSNTQENTLMAGLQLPSLEGINDSMNMLEETDVLDVLPAGMSAKAYKAKKIAATAAKVSNVSNGKKNQEKTPLEEHFAAIHQVLQSDQSSPAFISQVQTELTELLNLLKRIKSSDDASEALFNQLKLYVQGQGFNGKLRLLAERSPEPLKSWIMDVSASIWSIALDNSRHYLNELYQAHVYSFYQERLVNRYPLFKQQDEDIMLSDFVTFFKPGGIEHAFFNDYLKPFIHIKGDNWRIREVGKKLNLSDEYIQQLKRAALIRKVFFKGGNELDVQFSVKVNSLSQRISQFVFEVEAQSGVFNPKDLRKINKFHWPSNSSSENSAVYVKVKNKGNIKERDQVGKKRSGPWSIFRLLDALDVQLVKNNTYIYVNAQFRRHKVSFQIKPNTNSVMNPFSDDLLKKYRCLEHI